MQLVVVSQEEEEEEEEDKAEIFQALFPQLLPRVVPYDESDMSSAIPMHFRSPIYYSCT